MEDIIKLDRDVLSCMEEQFVGRIVDSEITPHKWRDRRWIQISTPFHDDENVHYELFCGKIELHFEGDKYEGKYGDFIKHLKSDSQKFDLKLEWEKWEHGYRCQCQTTIDWKNLLEVTKKFINFFDELIEEVIEEQQKINTPEQLTEKDDGEFEKQVEDVELYTRNLDSVIRLHNLSIPDYQRIYCWDENYVNCLLNDVYEYLSEDNKETPYRLGTIILHNNNGVYDIIDGQQRLVTLALLLLELRKSLPFLEQTFRSTESERYIAYNKYLINTFCGENLCGQSEKIEEFCKKLLEKIEFSVLVLKTQSLDLAYTFFSNQNDRGVPLTDYDLLKAHHLRHMSKNLQEQAELVARAWDKMIEEGSIRKEGRFTDYESTLDICIYRLRKWVRNKDIEDDSYYIKREYEAAPTIKGIPGFCEKFYFNEHIQGGYYFFAFVEKHLKKYKEFSCTEEYKALYANFTGGSHLWYRDVIEALLFEYYLKFEEQHLANALVVIMRCILQHRYVYSRSTKKSILKWTLNRDLALMIDRATSPTFFLAEVSNIIKEMPDPAELSDTQNVAKNAAKNVSKILKEKLIKSFRVIND